ncbi:hypothetical protein KY284_014400 [Solanum tuberosum]|nr:hypothetical protein KY284_014400 [Solanum tuberosum]
MLHVDLQFTENALQVIVEEGIAKNTGARGLRSILESILTEAMFEASDFNVEAAQQGVAYIDEAESLDIGSDVSEEDVQQVLLKMLEGTFLHFKCVLLWNIFRSLIISLVEFNLYFFYRLRQDSSIGFGASVQTNMRNGGLTDAAVTSSLLESVRRRSL